MVVVIVVMVIVDVVDMVIAIDCCYGCCYECVVANNNRDRIGDARLLLLLISTVISLIAITVDC